jgi:DNA (cytosine-5)-methyltransferase 1
MKPQYKIPSMQEINEIPWNGFCVASTFSGGGGSSLGYRMAGYKVLYANEFIDSARETYRANCREHTYLDGRDIREVTGLDILAKIGKGVGDLDVLDGSPPCCCFSTAGSREGGWGKVKKYSDKAQRSDDLFFEYARLVKEIQPKVFIAENVSGLIKGAAKGYFIDILKTLKGCGYSVECRVLDAAWLGVPQSRKRTIFVGVRNDIGVHPCHPKPLQYSYSIRDALGETLQIEPVEQNSSMSCYAVGEEWERIKIGSKSSKYFSLVRPNPDIPSPTITQEGGHPNAASVCHPIYKRKFSLAEVRALCSFPADFILHGNYSQAYERMGRAVPPIMMCEISKCVLENILKRIGK